MYAGYSGRRTRRSAMGFALDEVVNLVYLQEQLRRYTLKQPGRDACWLWNGPKQAYQSNGRWYWRARMFVTLERGYMQVSPAKLIYVIDAGTIEDRRRIAHTCHEPLCVRPDHIVLANQNKAYWARIKPIKRQQEREEMARLMADRAIEGVSGESVEQIKFYAWLGEPAKSIARNFGLSVRVVERILEKSDEPTPISAAQGHAHAV